MKLFLSYNSQHNDFVSIIAHQLVENGFEVYYARVTNEAGDDWLQEVQKSINNSQAALIFIGEYGIGPWQSKEIIKIISDCTKNEGYRIIPIIIPANNKFINYALPWFVADYQWIEFKDVNDHDAFSKLLDGIRKEGGVSPTGKNPYKGLESFGTGDAYCFFGRTYDLNLIFHSKLRLHMGAYNNNFLAVVGNSGVGKSSFVKAGILASLKGGKFTGSENWLQWVIKPGHSPLTALSAQLKQEGLITDSRLFEENALLHEDELLRTIRDQRENQVIFIDQFEEAVIQCKDEREKKAFLNNIARATETGKVVILVALRSDFYTSFAPYPLFKGLLERNNYTLPGMDAGEQDDESRSMLLREIIVRPAADAGVKMDEQLVNTLLYDVRNVKGVLPVLELTLDLVWKNRSHNTRIVLEDYAVVSQNRNLAGIIQVHADRVFNELTNNGTDKRKAELFRKIFVPYLVEVSANREDVRRTALKKELTSIAGHDSAETENMIVALSSERSRLLTTHHAGEATTVEVAHEVVIREWPLLKQWINERRDALAYLEKIRNDAEEFDRGKGERYRGRRLRKAKSWAKKNPDLLNESVTNLIKQSKARGRNFLLTLAGIMIILSISAAVLYKPYMRWRFINGIKSIPSLQEQVEAAGGNIDSVKTLKIDAKNYNYLNKKLYHFKNLERVSINNVPLKDLSILNGVKILNSLEIKKCNNLITLYGIKHNILLNSLWLEDLDSLNGLDGIERLNCSKSLGMRGNFRLSAWAQKNKFIRLDTLEICNNDYLFDLNDLKNFKILHFLHLSHNTGLKNLHGLEKVKTISGLRIYNCDSIIDIQGISKLKSLSLLEISNNRTLDNLNGIEGLDSLQFLKISNIRNLSDYNNISLIKNIRAIEVFNMNIQAKLFSFDSLHLLRSLNISNYDDMKTLIKIHSLRRLVIDGNINENILSQLQHLDSLELFNNSEFVNFSRLAHLESLSHISMTSCENIVDFEGLSKLPSLASIKISHNDELSNLKGIERLKNIQFLEVSSNKKLKDLSGIRNMKSLMTLKILYNEHLTNLDSMLPASLKYLEISDNPQFQDLGNLTSAEFLDTLIINESGTLLGLAYNPVTGKSLNPTTLILDSIIGYNKDTAKRVDKLGALINLKYLRISNSDNIISLRGLEKLTKLRRIEILHCSAFRSLTGIQDMKHLEVLLISGTYNLKNLIGIDKLELKEFILNDLDNSFDIGSIYYLKNLKHLTLDKKFTVNYNYLRKRNPGIKIITTF